MNRIKIIIKSGAMVVLGAACIILTNGCSGQATDSVQTANSEASNSSSKEASYTKALSGSWEDMKFTLDGEEYSLMFDYSQLAEAGWEYPDEMEIGPHGYTSGTLGIYNDEYDMMFHIGVKNKDSESKDITECKVYDVNMYGATAEKRPDVQLPGGITWGSTIEEVVAAYGEPSEEPEYEESYDRYTYRYRNDDGDTLYLTIYADTNVYTDPGVQEIMYTTAISH